MVNLSDLDSKLKELKVRQKSVAGGYNKRLSPFDYLLLGLVIVVLGVTALNGFVAGRERIKDNNKKIDIELIMEALDVSFVRSSQDTSDQRYPISQCSKQPNAYDYDVILYQDLVVDKKLINSQNFPKDSSGKYESQITVDSNCASVYNQTSEEGNFNADNKFCKYDLNSNKNCYLYTSSPSGDTYYLGFWSSSKEQYYLCKVTSQSAKSCEYR